MKKRAMKKWIPKNTCYCYGNKLVSCKWHKSLGINILNKETCEYAELCDTCHNCDCKITKCEYLNYTDFEEETHLWDQCKECNVSDIAWDMNLGRYKLRRVRKRSGRRI